MRKLLTKTAILSALAAAIMTVAASAAEIGTGVVDASSLRMRSEPSLSASTITYLPDGAVVSVHEQLDGWYKIVYHNMTGYVSADYLVYTPAAEASGGAEDQTTGEDPVVENENKPAVISGNDVNFRVAPGTDSEVLAQFDKGVEVEVISTEDGWCQVLYNGQTGYVAESYVAFDGVEKETKRGIVIASCLNVRSEASTESGIITKVYAGAVLDLLELKDNWYYINYNGVNGYISADYIREYTGSAASTIGDQVVALAMSYLGVPYVYGGASPGGFDCSGFTVYVFKQFGYSLPHSATSQWFNSGEYVERGDLQPGDIVLFADPARSNGKACSHVGIYIGNGEFIHASSSSSGAYVRISSLTSGYYNTYYKGAKRLG